MTLSPNPAAMSDSKASLHKAPNNSVGDSLFVKVLPLEAHATDDDKKVSKANQKKKKEHKSKRTSNRRKYEVALTLSLIHI